MNKKNEGKYKSKIIKNFIEEISPREFKKTERKMKLAAYIADTLKAREMKKQDLARALGKKASEISKWLSGTHNFTIETLWDIGDVLGIDLINPGKDKKEHVIYVASVSVAQKMDEPASFPDPDEIFSNENRIKLNSLKEYQA